MRQTRDLQTAHDKLAQWLTVVIEQGLTDSTIDAVIDQMQAIELQIADRDAQAERIAQLVDGGTPADEAEAEVTDEPIELIRRRNFIAHARAQGLKGAGFDALITAMHKDIAFHAHRQAMDDCVGYMNRTNRADNGYRFWFASDATVRKHATDELLEWFASHGRLTRNALRESVLSGQPIRMWQHGR